MHKSIIEKDTVVELISHATALKGVLLRHLFHT